MALAFAAIFGCGIAVANTVACKGEACFLCLVCRGFAGCRFAACPCTWAFGRCESHGTCARIGNARVPTPARVPRARRTRPLAHIRPPPPLRAPRMGTRGLSLHPQPHPCANCSHCYFVTQPRISPHRSQTLADSSSGWPIESPDRWTSAPPHGHLPGRAGRSGHLLGRVSGRRWEVILTSSPTQQFLVGFVDHYEAALSAGTLNLHRARFVDQPAVARE